jgi:hypothetical protein
MTAKMNKVVPAALLIALLCSFMRCLLAGQGYFTLNVFGSQYGLTRLKSFTFAAVNDRLLELPYDQVLLGIGVASCLFAVAIVWRHCRLRRTDA